MKVSFMKTGMALPERTEKMAWKTRPRMRENGMPFQGMYGKARLMHRRIP